MKKNLGFAVLPVFGFLFGVYTTIGILHYGYQDYKKSDKYDWACASIKQKYDRYFNSPEDYKHKDMLENYGCVPRCNELAEILSKDKVDFDFVKGVAKGVNVPLGLEKHMRIERKLADGTVKVYELTGVRYFQETSRDKVRFGDEKKNG